MKRIRPARSLEGRKYRESPRGRSLQMLRQCELRAAQKALPCNLTREWILERLELGKCELSGLPLEFTSDGTNTMRRDAPSIDRIDSSRGYTLDNCRVILWGLNAAFSTWGEDAFRDIALAWLGVKEQTPTVIKQAT